MKKFMTALMVFSLVLAGVSSVAAAEVPQALQGVDLSKAKQVTDQEAQGVRGSAMDGNAYMFNYKPAESPGDGVNDRWGHTDVSPPHGQGPRGM